MNQGYGRWMAAGGTGAVLALFALAAANRLFPAPPRPAAAGGYRSDAASPAPGGRPPYGERPPSTRPPEPEEGAGPEGIGPPATAADAYVRLAKRLVARRTDGGADIPAAVPEGDADFPAACDAFARRWPDDHRAAEALRWKAEWLSRHGRVPDARDAVFASIEAELSRLRATMATLGYGEAEVAAREREVFLKRVRPHVEAYLREDDYLAALPYADALLTRCAGSEEASAFAHLVLIRAYRRQRDRDMVIRIFEEELRGVGREETMPAEAVTAYTEALSNRGRDADAYRIYLRLAAHAPDRGVEANYLCLAAGAAYHAGRPVEGMRLYRRVVKDYADTHWSGFPADTLKRALPAEAKAAEAKGK